jgi:Ca2+-binding RTX toxin-like protein
MAVRKGNNYSNTIYGTGYDDAIYGYGGNDVLYGLGGSDFISGGSGHDRLYGGSGHDDLYGGSGNDRLSGGTGLDYLSGGSGNDVLIGGRGDDAMVGGSGVDTFVINAFDGDDIIYDFNLGVDWLDISGTDTWNPGELWFSDVFVNGEMSTEIDYGTGTVILVGIDQDWLHHSDYEDIIFA